MAAQKGVTGAAGALTMAGPMPRTELLSMSHDCEAVLEFWFGAPQGDAAAAVRGHEALWWGGGAETDAVIRRRFGALRQAAIAGELDAWASTARGRLALIILVDQFSRNVCRGSPQAYAHDALALEWCLDGLRHDYDRALRCVERVFFYMPLEHAESPPLQARCVELMQTLAEQVPAEQRAAFQAFTEHARGHQDIIRRFGRFPHRNAVLGRASTPQETEFLARA